MPDEPNTSGPTSIAAGVASPAAAPGTAPCATEGLRPRRHGRVARATWRSPPFWIALGLTVVGLWLTSHGQEAIGSTLLTAAAVVGGGNAALVVRAR